MSWNALPIELKNKILEKRNEMYYKSVNIIKKAWLISRNKYLTAKKLFIDYQIENIESREINTRIIKLLKFTSKIILKKKSFSKEDIDFWQDKLDYIEIDLGYEQYTGEVTVIECNIIREHLYLIANKLNIKFIHLWRKQTYLVRLHMPCPPPPLPLLSPHHLGRPGHADLRIKLPPACTRGPSCLASDLYYQYYLFLYNRSLLTTQ